MAVYSKKISVKSFLFYICYAMIKEIKNIAHCMKTTAGSRMILYVVRK
ncbi:hypothetical protein DORFOR_00976 [Dorea formicigenerans ATCC 27755]|uniref:Uncharacterized protein n=1 Tax=Dorea formicigenerans ATCC 27755 TaxID=411461 RepID=B0G3Z9_9FIRM|nr:hypothetical protein DORFOR_00976 [Dorea formicigenerans ATCC 27755]